MRIIVDRERCEGHGLCEQSAPDLLRLDDEGNPEILADEIPQEFEHSAGEAVGVCPVAALRLRLGA